MLRNNPPTPARPTSGPANVEPNTLILGFPPRQSREASAEQIASQARACLAVGDIEGANRLLSKLENK